MFTNRAKVAEFALSARKPTVAQFGLQAEAGLLMAYSADELVAMHLYGTYAAKILAGAKPGDLPIQQPSVYRWVVNLKTAKMLGRAIPPSLVTRVDEVIE
jgi:putative tryptophan/tyrosine transport system substrate-binding protein